MAIYNLTAEQRVTMNQGYGASGLRKVISELGIGDGVTFLLVNKVGEGEVIYTGEHMTAVQDTELVEGEVRFEGALGD